VNLRPRVWPLNDREKSCVCFGMITRASTMSGSEPVLESVGQSYWEFGAVTFDK